MGGAFPNNLQSKYYQIFQCGENKTKIQKYGPNFVLTFRKDKNKSRIMVPFYRDKLDNDTTENKTENKFRKDEKYAKKRVTLTVRPNKQKII